jgi:hypothetical protein
VKPNAKNSTASQQSLTPDNAQANGRAQLQLRRRCKRQQTGIERQGPPGGRTVGGRRITSSQTIADHENDTADDPKIINPWNPARQANAAQSDQLCSFKG